MRMNKPLNTKFAVLLILVLCASLAVPAFAAAQGINPTDSQYADQLTQVDQGAQPPGGSSSGPSGGDSGSGSGSGLGGRVGPLPFTGFDVIAMAAVALAVAGLGLGLQRAVSRQPSDRLS